MMDEVQQTVDFISSFLKHFTYEQLQSFRDALEISIVEKIKNHWYPDKPDRGNAHRCIRVNEQIDPILKEAAKVCNLPEKMIKKNLPLELTIWIDPGKVCYRIGEIDGSICVLYETPAPANENIHPNAGCKTNVYSNLNPSATCFKPQAHQNQPRIVRETDPNVLQFLNPLAACFQPSLPQHDTNPQDLNPSAPSFIPKFHLKP